MQDDTNIDEELGDLFFVVVYIFWRFWVVLLVWAIYSCGEPEYFACGVMVYWECYSVGKKAVSVFVVECGGGNCFGLGLLYGLLCKFLVVWSIAYLPLLDG